MEQNSKPRPTQEIYLERIRLEKLTNYEDDFFNLLEPILQNYNWELEITQYNGKYGLKDWAGNQLLPNEFDNFKLLSGFDLKPGNRVCVVVNNKEGVVRIEEGAKYTWILAPEYEYVSYPGLYTSVQQNNKWGMYNLNTLELVLPIEFDKIEDFGGFVFCNDIAKFRKGEKYGVMNTAGEKTDAYFDEIEEEFEGYVRARIGEEWGYIQADHTLTQDSDEAVFYYNDGAE